jgi:hypothetical protein
VLKVVAVQASGRLINPLVVQRPLNGGIRRRACSRNLDLRNDAEPSALKMFGLVMGLGSSR